MLIESLIAIFLLGWLAGIPIGALITAQRSHRHIGYYRAESIRQAGRAEEAERRSHRGTPYRLDTIDRARLALFDNIAGTYDDHNASRRAPDAPVVSLPRPRVTA